eukprot:228354-Pelagomonas_calceolata.AAC.4
MRSRATAWRAELCVKHCAYTLVAGQALLIVQQRKYFVEAKRTNIVQKKEMKFQGDLEVQSSDKRGGWLNINIAAPKVVASVQAHLLPVCVDGVVPVSKKGAWLASEGLDGWVWMEPRAVATACMRTCCTGSPVHLIPEWAVH